MKSRRIIWIVALAIFFIGAVVILKLRSQGSNKADGGSVTAVSVTVSKVGHGSVARKLEVTGILEGINETEIISETSGKITKINADVETYLTANSSVAEVENDLQEIAVEAARANSDKADADLKRVKNLFSQNAVSETQLENAQVGAKAALAQLTLAQKNYDNTFLKTPIAGRLAQKFVVIGQMITPGTKVATVVDDSRMRLKVGIPENFVLSVKRDGEVQVKSDAVPYRMFSGKVKTIALKADPQTRTFQAEIELPNDHERSLKSGMFAKAEITIPKDSKPVVIPIAALIEASGSNPSVFVVKDSLVSLRYVVVGAKNDSLVEIVSGLGLNDLVVSFGQQNVRDGTKVRYTIDN
jgi:membrane fusion protein, multidrug efflux system